MLKFDFPTANPISASFNRTDFKASDRTVLDLCFGNLSFIVLRTFMTGMAIHADVIQETR
jgi:hypothetical protein